MCIRDRIPPVRGPTPLIKGRCRAATEGIGKWPKGKGGREDAVERSETGGEIAPVSPQGAPSLTRHRADEDIGPYEDGRTICVGREKVNWPEGPRLRPQARFEANRRKAAALGPR